MSKKMKKIPSIFKSKEANRQPHWQWPLPSCKHPKTLSFRATTSDDVFKTVNSVFLDTSIDVLETLETPESWFTNSSECASTFSADEHSDDNNNVESPSLEAIMKGVRSSERLFFEPGETSSILKEPEISGRAALLPFKESVALALESDDPYSDFKKSMQEMVESHGLKEWDCLEELLGWYLRMNGKSNHGFIVGAFVDLLVGMANDHHRGNDSSGSSMAVCCSDTSTTSYSSAGSCFDSPTSPRSPTGGVMVGDGNQMGIDDVAVVVGQP
ncbi:transcription repressor OFP13 [Sesamum indicum]|uniref:Transcription repressor n=1 Tax=Sesamum indicum TaxID=4182 RepID=A0A6I9T442_SESIN|nr:transcription repressor OFP13 [Sesamum indicum]